MRIALALAAALTSLVLAAAQRPPGTIQLSAAELSWKPAPPSMPKGVEIAVLEGDPRQAGPFTVRLRGPAGVRIAPHTHPAPERVTVLEGAIGVGFGRAYDEKSLRVFRAGDFYINPTHSEHYVGFVEPTVVQITGEGPWTLDFLVP